MVNPGTLPGFFVSHEGHKELIIFERLFKELLISITSSCQREKLFYTFLK
jgi:hypothetical protein